MGSIFAHDLAESAKGNDELSQLRLRVAIETHFQFNHYPPLPYTLVDTALEIIARYKRGETEEPVDLPAGVSWRDKPQAPFWECVRAWHLDAFLQEPDEESE